MALFDLQKSTHLSSPFTEALKNCWTALVALAGFVYFSAVSFHPILAGACIVIAAVLAMNGMARTDLLFTSRGPSFWRSGHLSVFHRLFGEGEMAGIVVGVVVWFVLLLDGHVVPIELAPAATILGIMMMATFTLPAILPLLTIVERFFGLRAAIVLGALSASLFGEPAAAVFLSNYLRPRIREDQDTAKVATGVAAAVGSGGALMPFAAPPILVIWTILQQSLGWNLWTLVGVIGVGAILHVSSVALLVAPYVQALETKVSQLKARHLISLTILVGLILWHVFLPGPAVYLADCVIGVVGTVFFARRYRVMEHGDHSEERHATLYLPWILAGLLLSIEVIGHAADPAVALIAHALPTSLPVPLVAFLLFAMTTVVSHGADNALASRVFIAVPASLLLGGVVTASTANVYAAAVVAGSLFGGFLLISGNLPNFFIKNIFCVKPDVWLKAAWRYYATGVVYLVWIAALIWLVPIVMR